MSSDPVSKGSRRFLDALLAWVILPAALLMRHVRRKGARRYPRTFRRLKRLGVMPIRDHYYEPLFNDAHLRRPLDEKRELPGIDLRVTAQLALLADLPGPEAFEDRLRSVGPDDVGAFRMDNGNFEAGDAEFLYQFVRHLRPRTVIEIGSGESTKLIRWALADTLAEGGGAARQICIEPYEKPWLERLSGIDLRRARVEEVDMDWATVLEPGDLLFIDSSHVIRPQGDVVTEYLYILPRLASGVFVHVHDVFTPRDYRAGWVVDEVRLWNEQYLMEGVLGNADRYEVVAALNYLKHDHFAALKRVCPHLGPMTEPGSFYFRVRN